MYSVENEIRELHMDFMKNNIYSLHFCCLISQLHNDRSAQPTTIDQDTISLCHAIAKLGCNSDF